MYVFLISCQGTRIGTCIERTRCIKWTLEHSLSVSTQYTVSQYLNSLTDAHVRTALNSFKVVIVSLTPSIDEPFTSFGGSIEEVAWNVTKAGPSSRGEIAHWRETK